MTAKDAWALTEREKQTLRLIVRGHDAKSAARALGLSIHTINERLRDARRKMAVSSSREAARLLLEVEAAAPPEPTPENAVYDRLGEDAASPMANVGVAPIAGTPRLMRRHLIVVGGLAMTLILGLSLLSALPQASTPSLPMASAPAADAEVVDMARAWLTLMDQARWGDSYRMTGSAFRKLNTLKAWTAASERVRQPLGAMVSRTFLSEENLPAPPAGYEVVRFDTGFANKARAVETVTLDREGGRWRVVGVTIG